MADPAREGGLAREAVVKQVVKQTSKGAAVSCTAPASSGTTVLTLGPLPTIQILISEAVLYNTRSA